MPKKTTEEKELEKEQRNADVDLENEEVEIEEEESSEPKVHVSTSRQAIMDKANSARQKRIKQDIDDLDDEGKQMIALAEQRIRGDIEEEDDALSLENEEETPPKEENPDEIAAETPKETPSEDVDSPDDVVTIKVDGEERQVSQSEVEAAGVAALQKEHAADKKLNENVKYENSLRNLESSLTKRFEDLQQRIDAAKDLPASDDQSEQSAEDIKKLNEKVASAIFSGDPEAVTEALTSLQTSVAQGRTSSTPPLDAKEFASVVIDSLREQAEEEKKVEVDEQRVTVAKTVNTTFETEFKELYDDDRSFRLTKAEFETLCEESPTADRVELMRQAGNNIQDLLKPPVESELERRRSRKRATPETPSTTARAPSKKKARRKKRSDVVAEMQRKRGQRQG